MTTEKRQDMQPQVEKPEELSPEELEAQAGAELPDREAMSLINPNLTMPPTLGGPDLGVMPDPTSSGAPMLPDARTGPVAN